MSRQLDSEILQGKIIICTYPEKEPDNFFEIVNSSGAVVHYLPMIDVLPVSFKMAKPIGTYNWLVFTSKNGVVSFLSQEKPSIQNKIAALGESTANELKANGWTPDFVGSGKSAADFATELKSVLLPEDETLLILGNLAPNTLQGNLSGECKTERVNVYETRKPKTVNTEILQLIEDEQYDAIIVTSPSAITNLYSSLKKNKDRLKVISIGQTTTAAARALNIEPLATATNASYEGLAQTTIEYFKKP